MLNGEVMTAVGTNHVCQ